MDLASVGLEITCQHTQQGGFASPLVTHEGCQAGPYVQLQVAQDGVTLKAQMEVGDAQEWGTGSLGHIRMLMRALCLCRQGVRMSKVAH